MDRNKLKQNKWIIIVVAVVLVLSFFHIIPISDPPKTSTATALHWGAYAGDNDGDLENFEQLVGHRVDIQAVFIGWNDPFPEKIANSLNQQGKTLLIFWEPYDISLDEIQSGKSDEYMNSFAVAARASGAEIILAPLHEMNGNWDPWDGYDENNHLQNKPELIISVWKKIHAIFADAANVKLAWVINNDSVPTIAANQADAYYPGSAFVDYVGVDGFNFGNPWQTFKEVFDRSLVELASYNKPIYIFSTASAPGADKDEWIRNGLGEQIQQYPNIAGWVWFNQNGPERNWTVNSDSNSLAAFKSVIP